MKITDADLLKVEDLLKRTFIKLRSDWGFKRAFATPENAEVLKKLRCVLHDRHGASFYSGNAAEASKVLR